MKLSVSLIAFLILLFTAAFVKAQTNTESERRFDWALRIGSSGDDAARGVAADGQGNIYIVGTFPGTVSLDSTTLTSRGDDDFFLLKLNREGALLWIKQFGAEQSDRAYDVVVDRDDHPIMTGWFGGTVAFDEFSITSTGLLDGFTARLDPGGNVVWVQTIAGSGVEGGNEIAALPDSGIAVAANTNRSAVVAEQTVPNSGDRDGFVIVYEPDGRLRWVRPFSATGFDQMRGIAGDAQGNILIGGAFSGALETDNGRLNSRGDLDAYAAKLDPTGHILWVRQYGSTGEDIARGIGSDAMSSVYLSGAFEGLVEFGSETLESMGEADVYVVKLAADGTEQWVRQIGGDGDDGGCEIDVSANGTFYLAGDFSNTVSIQGEQLTSTGRTDLMMLRFSTDGILNWALSAGGRSMDIHYALVSLPGSGLVSTGTVRATSRFGELSLSIDLGGTDMFIAYIDD